MNALPNATPAGLRRRGHDGLREHADARVPNARWSMGFMRDALGDGRPSRIRTVVDILTRERLGEGLKDQLLSDEHFMGMLDTRQKLEA